MSTYVIEVGLNTIPRCPIYSKIYPIHLATCNLHGRNNKAGLSVLIPHINIKQYIFSAPVTQEPNKKDCWLEAGGISLGPINVDAAMALPDSEYHTIQVRNRT